MKRLITGAWFIAWFIPLFAIQAFAGEYSALARVTVYWPGEGSGANAAWNGALLREGHCAVDPKKVPYGSKVVFHDAESGRRQRTGRCQSQSGPLVRAKRNGTQRDRDRSFFPYKREGSYLGKCESTFHGGESSPTRYSGRVLKFVPKTNSPKTSRKRSKSR